MQIEIQCPTHGTIETLELPDSYKDFEGEVSCPTKIPNHVRGAKLKIKIKDGKLIVLRASGGSDSLLTAC